MKNSQITQNQSIDSVILKLNAESEQKLNSTSTKTFFKERFADTFGNISYSFIMGSITDYLAGLNLQGIIASRTSGIGMNAITGPPYGMWRDFVFSVTKTNSNSSPMKKYFADLLAFNTVQVPLYGCLVAIGSYISEGEVKWDKVMHGAAYLAMISPIIGPTMGWYMDKCRKMFGVKSSQEKVNLS